MPNVVLVILTLALGWAMLWPARTRLGAVGYHLSALPAGLLVWPVVACAVQLLGVPYRWPAVAPIALVFVVLTAAGMWWLARRPAENPAAAPAQSPAASTAADWRSFALWGTVVISLAVVVELLGLTVGFRDSMFHYELSGRWLYDTGTFRLGTPAAFGYGVPGLLATNHLLGGEWTFVVFPVMSMNVLALTVWMAISGSATSVALRTRALVTLAIVALMATAPIYLERHTFYTHSNMISALYAVLGVVAALRAFADPSAPFRADHERHVAPAVSSAWLAIVGFSAAGLAFARVDGLVYQLVLMLVATVVCMTLSAPVSRLAAMFVPALALTWGTNLAVVARMGVWKHPDKLSGTMALAVLAAVTAYAAGVLVVGRIRAVREWAARPRAFVSAIVAINVVALLGAWMLRPRSFWLSTTNMIANLSYAANYGKVWYFLLGVLLLSLIFGHLWRKTSMSTTILYAVVQFQAVATVVHALTHPGRIHPADSYARVAFSLVPLLFAYAAVFVNGMLATWSPAGEKTQVAEKPGEPAPAQP